MVEQRDYGLVNHTFPAELLGMCDVLWRELYKGCHPCSQLLHRILLVISHIGSALTWLHLQLHLSIPCAYYLFDALRSTAKRKCNVAISRPVTWCAFCMTHMYPCEQVDACSRVKVCVGRVKCFFLSAVTVVVSASSSLCCSSDWHLYSTHTHKYRPAKTLKPLTVKKATLPSHCSAICCCKTHFFNLPVTLNSPTSEGPGGCFKCFPSNGCTSVLVPWLTILSICSSEGATRWCSD